MVEKIGILTFHVAHNYGAMLQAYALPIAVRDLGYDCEIIDYRFPYIYNWGIVENWQDLIKKHGLLIGTLKWGNRKIRGVYSSEKKINKFNIFREKYIIHSSKIYSKKEELNNMQYDAVLFGSDQIWNDALTNGKATEFFGDFSCENKIKKISYAASCGKRDFTPEYKKEYLKLLKDFSNIGVREHGLAESLIKEGLNAKSVLDPTLLLDKPKWDSMIKFTNKKKTIIEDDYLLVYAFDEDENLYNFVDEIAKKNNLKVVVISYEKKDIMDKYFVLEECGPIEFVQLIANSKMVITTSFHGTAFSIIYNKEFYCIPHPKYSERTDSLLSMVGLLNRNIKGYDKVYENKKIDWDKVNKIICEERKKSIDFLKEAIEGEK